MIRLQPHCEGTDVTILKERKVEQIDYHKRKENNSKPKYEVIMQITTLWILLVTDHNTSLG